MWISSIGNRHLSSNAAALVGPHIRVVHKCILWCPWCSWITRSHQTSSGHCKGNGTVSILWWKLHHRVQVIEFKCWWRYEHERSWKGITKAFGWVCVCVCVLFLFFASENRVSLLPPLPSQWILFLLHTFVIQLFHSESFCIPLMALEVSLHCWIEWNCSLRVRGKATLLRGHHLSLLTLCKNQMAGWLIDSGSANKVLSLKEK